MNKVTISGRLATDPKCNYTPTQTAILNLLIAVDRPSKQGEEKKTDFPRVTVFGKQAENCEKFLQKGSRCIVEGRLETSEYTKNGEKRYSTIVMAERVEFIDFKESSPNFTGINENIPF